MISKKGFSLIEMMVVTAVFGVIATSMGSLILNQLQSVQYMEDKISQNSFNMDLKQLVENSDACDASLLNLLIPNIGAAPVSTTLKDKNGTVIYDTGDPTKNIYDRLQISSIMVSNLDITPLQTSGTLKMTVATERQRRGGGGSMLRPIEYKISVGVNAARRVTECSPSALTPPPIRFLSGAKASCPVDTAASGCSADGEKSCVPDGGGIYGCYNTGARGSSCYLFCRK